MSNPNNQFLRQQSIGRQFNWLRNQMLNRLRRTKWTPEMLADELWLIGSTLADAYGTASPTTDGGGVTSGSSGGGFVGIVQEDITAADGRKPGVGKGLIFRFDGSTILEATDDNNIVLGPQSIYNTTSSTVSASEKMIQVKQIGAYYFIDVEDCEPAPAPEPRDPKVFIPLPPPPEPPCRGTFVATGYNPLVDRYKRRSTGTVVNPCS